MAGVLKVNVGGSWIPIHGYSQTPNKADYAQARPLGNVSMPVGATEVQWNYWESKGSIMDMTGNDFVISKTGRFLVTIDIPIRATTGSPWVVMDIQHERGGAPWGSHQFLSSVGSAAGAFNQVSGAWAFDVVAGDHFRVVGSAQGAYTIDSITAGRGSITFTEMSSVGPEGPQGPPGSGIPRGSLGVNALTGSISDAVATPDDVSAGGITITPRVGYLYRCMTFATLYGVSNNINTVMEIRRNNVAVAKSSVRLFTDLAAHSFFAHYGAIDTTPMTWTVTAGSNLAATSFAAAHYAAMSVEECGMPGVWDAAGGYSA